MLYAQKAKNTIIQNSALSDGEIFIKTITTKGDQVKETSGPRLARPLPGAQQIRGSPEIKIRAGNK